MDSAGVLKKIIDDKKKQDEQLSNINEMFDLAMRLNRSLIKARSYKNQRTKI